MARLQSIVDYERGQKNKGKVFKGLLSRGFTKEESAVIMGNLRQESAYDPQAELRGAGEDSYGLMQWRESRLDSLKALADEQDKDVSDIDVQLDFIKKELKGGGYETKQFKKAMAHGSSLEEKTMGFAKYVERPAASELRRSSSSYKNRTKAAKEFFDMEVEPDLTGYSAFPTELLDTESLGTKPDLTGYSEFPSELLDRDTKTGDFKAMAKEVAEKPVTEAITRMPFKKAFDMARSLGLKEFTWDSRQFTTKKKGEDETPVKEEFIDTSMGSDPIEDYVIDTALDLDGSFEAVNENTPRIASTDGAEFVNQVVEGNLSREPATEQQAPVSTPVDAPIMSEEPLAQEPLEPTAEATEELETVPRTNLGARKVEYSNLIEDLSKFTFEGMGDDLINKFTDRNAVGFLTEAAISSLMQTNKVDPNFNIEEGSDKELYTEMTKGLEADAVVEVLDNSYNRADFIKNASLAIGKMERKKEMQKYTQDHPVLSGVNTVGNMLVEGAVFMPIGTMVAGAAKATKIKVITDLTRSSVGGYVLGELVEQGAQELIWSKYDKDYEFDPIMFAGSIGMGVGLKSLVGSPEADKAFRDFLKNENGFINIATKEGKRLVDEIATKVGDNQAIALAARLTKKKIKVANEIRKNLDSKRTSLLRRMELLDSKIKNSVDKAEIKKFKGMKQKISRQVTKFDKNLPNELDMLARGSHPKLSSSVNPEFTVKQIAKEIGIPEEMVNSLDKTRKFLGLDQPNIDPEFVLEGEKAYETVARSQLREMAENRRLNMNETLKYAAGSGVVKKLDEMPILGKLQVGDKLNYLASTDGPISRFLFNKGNLVSSENPRVAAFYNFMAPDGMGRQGMSKIRAIESQQKYANIFGGDLMNMYHTHGSRIYDKINNSAAGTKLKGFLSPDDYELTVEPILKDRLLMDSGAFRAKYGDEIAGFADEFYDDFNKLNKKIIDRAKELGVEGVDFDATDGWFHRSWDFRKARAVDQEDLQETVFRAMKSHAEKLGIKNIDDASLMKHARKFSFGIRNADITSIDGLQSDHMKLLEKLLSKSEGMEAKTIRTEIERLKMLKAKSDAGDLANRVQMDVTQKMANGKSLADLFEDNVISTQKRYTARMSARIAAAEHGIKNLDTLDEWVTDAVQDEIKRLAAKGVKDPQSKAKFIEDAMRQDLMSFKHGGMVGLHDLPDDTATDFLRLVKKYNFARLMQYTGISSIAELGGTFVEAGVSTTLGEMSRYMRNHFNDLFLDNPEKYVGRLYDELRTITGVGMEDFSFSSKGLSKSTRVFEDGALGAVEKGVDVLGRTAQAPFGGIEKVGRRITANALAIKWGNHFNGTESGGILSAFFGSNGVTNRVLENSGFGSVDSLGKFIPNKTYNNIQKSMKQFATFDDSGRLVKLNLEKWDNNTAHAFGDAIQMQSNHIMVNPDATTMALWQSSTVGQILNQFRSFTVNATTKVFGATVANAAISSNRGDHSEMIKAGQKIFWGTSLGMLSVSLRQGIQRAGGDKEVDLFDEGLIKAAAIGFSRSSVAGNLPTIGDSMSGFFGYDPIFEKASSVGRSKNFFNLATTPTGQAIGGAYQGVEKAVQGDFKGSGMQLLKVSPVYRQIGAQQIFNFIDDEK